MTVVTDVTNVVERVMPSVVSVTNKYLAQQQDYFGQTLESEQSASGSGIIVGESDTELLIATNYHVVEGADSLMVQFIDGTEAEAQMKGSDSGMDLAVMAIQLENLSEDTKNAIVIAKLGDSEGLKVGEPAIAIGNSLGYGQSVTTGVISAVNRSIVDETQNTPTGTGSESITSLIQTDAAINPGNSGGALLNMNGEVVGINSNKIGGSVIEGMGYAIPISSAKPIIEDLMTKTTKVKVADGDKAYLGISGVDVTSEAAGAYGLPEGVYIAQVYDDTAAAHAGLVKGDIITKFDGSSVNSMEELQKMLQYYSAGTTVDVTIQQGSPTGYQEKTIAVTLGTKPDQMVQ
jgi:serine protease Do